MADTPLTACQAQVIRWFKLEPKKTLALTVLVVIMAGMWGKVVFTGKPQRAAASANVGSAAAGVDAAMAMSPQMSQAAAALQEFTKSPVALIHRNLFLVKLDYFVQDGASGGSGETAADGFWEELEKSLASKADQEKTKRILAENLQSQASRLELQSTVMSNGMCKAMVNGMLVGAGDTIGGFRVVKVEAKRVIVEREGVRLEVYFRF